MSENERSYYRARAEQEIRAAQSAGHPEASRAHYVLAGYYLDLAYNPAAAVGQQRALGGEQGRRPAVATNMPANGDARRRMSPEAMTIRA